MSDQEDQEDELLALSSIYDNDSEVFKMYKEDGLNGGEILAFPVLPNHFSVKILKNKKGTNVNNLTK